MSDFSKAVELQPGAESYIAREAVFRDLGDLDLAIADLDRALALDPRSELALYRRGEARRLQGDPEGAIEDFRRCDALAGKLQAIAGVRIAEIKEQQDDER